MTQWEKCPVNTRTVFSASKPGVFNLWLMNTFADL